MWVMPTISNFEQQSITPANAAVAPKYGVLWSCYLTKNFHLDQRIRA
jgi:hypothetical protein